MFPFICRVGTCLKPPTTVPKLLLYFFSYEFRYTSEFEQVRGA